MTSAKEELSAEANRGANWPAAIASLCVGAAFLALWFWLLPGWLGFHEYEKAAAGWRLIFIVPAALGFAVAIKCIWDFGWTGHGTPAPMAPPQRLVVVGLYRYARNPMYTGFLLGWFSLWMLYGQANRGSLIVAVAAVVGLMMFVHLYEEPTLERKFGADYQNYCKSVPRWIPRLSPWTS
ncbi:MAG: methyltransferase family protein [Candidatus Acidiferrales bacterium]